MTSPASPACRRIASLRVRLVPSCINRSRVRRPQSGAVLNDAVARPDVVQQKIAERVNGLAAQGGGDDEGALVDHGTGGCGRDRPQVTDVAADEREQLIAALRAGRGRESLIPRWSL